MGEIDIDFEQVKKLVSEFNSLVVRRNKAEKWFDKPTTTDAEREKWKSTIFKLHEDIDVKIKKLEALGIEMETEFIQDGIGVEESEET